MICGPCRKGGDLARYGTRRRKARYRNIITQTAKLYHSKCQGKGFCDCQHSGPLIPQPVKDVSE